MNWTDQTDIDAASFFDSLPIAEIRHRQSLCREQQSRAYEQGNIDAIENLDRMERALTESVMRRLGEC